MHTSRDYYHRDGLASGRCSRVSAVCRSPSPTSHHMCNAYRHSHHMSCACPLSTHCTGKSVSFQDEHCNVGRSKSVCRAGYPGSFMDGVSSCYRHSSLVPVSRDFSGDCKTGDYANLTALLRRLSILQIEMKGLLHGKSLKERSQVIGHKLDDDVGGLAASAKLNPSKDVWLLEKNSDGNSKKGNKQEQNQAMDTCKWNHKREGCRSPRKFETREPEKQTKPECTNDENQDDPWRERKQIAQLWREYNCDLHLRRIIDSSRREAACRILEKVIHRRLTCYMLQYITAVAKGLMGDEKTDYLRFFKREGPFRNKPLNEGTYGELLVFVDKQAKPAKDVMKALQISEEGLEEEGGREGFNPYAIGDIRAQMRAFLTVGAATPSGSTSAIAAMGEEDDDFFSTEFLQDLIHAADQGKLGPLQKAHKLVKLACFLSLKCLGFPRPS